MVIYKSDVPESGATYTVDGDWISIEDKNGVIKFLIPKDGKEPLYLKLLGFPGEPVRDEVERLIEAVKYMRRGPKGQPMQSYEDTIAHILGMTYGKYMEKKRKGEIRYILKRN
jgi:hypothetical protein